MRKQTPILRILGEFRSGHSWRTAAGLMLWVVCTTIILTAKEQVDWSSHILTIALYVGVAIVLFAALVLTNLYDKPVFWLAMSLSIFGYLIIAWPGASNHTYIYGYLCIILFIITSHSDESRSALNQSNMRILLLLTMLLAVFQKIITPGYLDGSINAFWLVNGGYGKPIYLLSDVWTSIVEKNHDALHAYYNLSSYKVDQIVLTAPVNNLRSAGKIIAGIIIIGELVVGILFMWSKSNIWRHSVLLLFICFVYLIRQEAGFLSLLCIIGVSCCQDQDDFWKASYLLIFILMQVAIVFEYGYN